MVVLKNDQPVIFGSFSFLLLFVCVCFCPTCYSFGSTSFFRFGRAICTELVEAHVTDMFLMNLFSCYTFCTFRYKRVRHMQLYVDYLNIEMILIYAFFFSKLQFYFWFTNSHFPFFLLHFYLNSHFGSIVTLTLSCLCRIWGPALDAVRRRPPAQEVFNISVHQV